ELTSRAGDGIRTRDVQLGKLAGNSQPLTNPPLPDAKFCRFRQVLQVFPVGFLSVGSSAPWALTEKHRHSAPARQRRSSYPAADDGPRAGEPPRAGNDGQLPHPAETLRHQIQQPLRQWPGSPRYPMERSSGERPAPSSPSLLGGRPPRLRRPVV